MPPKKVMAKAPVGHIDRRSTKKDYNANRKSPHNNIAQYPGKMARVPRNLE